MIYFAYAFRSKYLVDSQHSLYSLVQMARRISLAQAMT